MGTRLSGEGSPQPYQFKFAILLHGPLKPRVERFVKLRNPVLGATGWYPTP